MRIDKTKLVGQRFGILTVISWGMQSVVGKKSLWLCKCDCGSEVHIIRSNLISGNSSSCGCKEGKFTHGHSVNGRQSRTYKSWSMMIVRCKATSGESYDLYSGRGIKVCESWHSFENFLKDMGERPLGMTLDRRDTNGNYEPNNCRWASAKQQARNMRTNKIITYAGQSLCISEWAEVTGINRSTIVGRLRRGWTVEQTFTLPMNGK